MYAMWSDPAVTRYIGGKTFSREEVWERLLRYAGTWTMFGYGFWVIREKVSGDFVGEVGFHSLHRNIVPPFGDRPELGFAPQFCAHMAKVSRTEPLERHSNGATRHGGNVRRCA